MQIITVAGSRSSAMDTRWSTTPVLRRCHWYNDWPWSKTTVKKTSLLQFFRRNKNGHKCALFWHKVKIKYQNPDKGFCQMWNRNWNLILKLTSINIPKITNWFPPCFDTNLTTKALYIFKWFLLHRYFSLIRYIYMYFSLIRPNINLIEFCYIYA